MAAQVKYNVKRLTCVVGVKIQMKIGLDLMSKLVDVRCQVRDPDDFFRVQQQREELLRDYIQLFNDMKILEAIRLGAEQVGFRQTTGGIPKKKTLPQANNKVEIRKVIHSVHGGITCGGECRKDRRAYTWQPIAQVSTARNDGPSITFTAEDTVGVLYPHDDALVVTLDVGNCTIKRILMDTESSADIVFSRTLDKMGISPMTIQSTRATLVGYDGNESLAKGKIILLVTAKNVTQMVEMMVVDTPSSYNMILGGHSCIP
ncbi:hypothetical protein FNV43_RR17037 [Rhamnella rubrinervis]|uniref:Peptidase A2 domain-containing protein n=1 Tax=Rhamnella rubrinervis TaxID=2594499 RepID=A0A8K0GZV5_9ROSA|nr:hypothetical protein FNV43_RR17037 [Rhamnella rubrinervis]